MAIEVVPYRDEWPLQFEQVAESLRTAMSCIPSSEIEHVGSTSVPGLAAKPILDIDVIVDSGEVSDAIAALKSLGYVHRGNLGVEGREAFLAPDESPPRHVYVCQRGALSVRNHLAVRDVLRRRPDLRDAYGAIKLSMGADPKIEIDSYIAEKSPILKQVLAEEAFTPEELDAIFSLNTTPPQ